MSFTVPAGNNRLLVVTSSGAGNNTDISSVTWNGSGMTQAAKKAQGGGTNSNAGIWYVTLGSSASPTTANVTVTYGSNFFFEMTATAFSNVDQSTPVSGATTGTSASLAVTSATGSMVIDAIALDGTTAAPSAGQTLVAVAHDLVFNGQSGGASTAPGASSVTMTWSPTGGNLVHAGVSINSTDPVVTSISPTSGAAAGGNSVTITGRGFTGATAVKFGATAATGFTVNSATQITATAPAGTGTVDVTVTTPGGTSATSAADQFTYVSAPTVTSLSPTAGPAAGGTTVMIAGTNLTGATAVSFGGAAATGFTVNSATSISATSPAGTGTVDVRVTTVGGTSATSAADQFTYVLAPTVTSLSPTAGGAGGGTTVTLTGANLTGATAVTFGGTNATGFTVNSATSITATSPAGTGTVDVRVTTVGGTSATSAADQFTYQAIAACLADTTQADFQAGVGTNVDTTTNPGNVTLGGGLLDQSNTAGTTTGTGFGAVAWTGQTFIPSITGPLTKVEFQFFGSGVTAPAPDFRVSIRATSGGLPTGADLAAETVPGDSSGATITRTVTFSSPVTVSSGTQYALILRPVSAPSGSGYFWIRSSPSTYASGQRVLTSDSGASWSADATRDYNFKTYIGAGYAPSGNLISSMKDAVPDVGVTPRWRTLSWTATTPVGTDLSFQVAGSNNPAGPFNFVGPDTTAATFFTVNGTSMGQFNGFRYLKYKAVFLSSDNASTPTLQDVTVCYDNTPVPPPTVTLSTTSVNANATSVIINGTDFDTTPLNNSVTFSGAFNGSGTVTAATSTQLTVSISPTAVGALSAVVTTNAQSSGAAVQVATVTPVVTSSTSNLAANATSLIINGAGFSATPANNTVVFNNGATGTVTAATSTSLTVTSLGGLVSGSLTATVTTNSVSSGSAVQVATVIPVVTSSLAIIQATGTTVTINGFGFDASNVNNAVTFNLGATGTVTTSSLTQLVVTFGTKPTAGDLTAVVTSNTQSSGAAVQVAAVIALSITSSTTALVQSSATLDIVGNGFSTTPASNTVTFDNGAVGTVTSASETLLTVTFSTKATSLGALNATVTVSGVGTAGPAQVATVVAGAPAKLAVITQPTNAVSATAISPSVTVQIQDANGFLTTSTANVTMAIGTNPGSGTLSGTVTVAAVAGTATFSTLQIDKAGTGYTLSATSGVLTPATSGTFDITAGAPAKLAVITQPTNAVSATAIAPAVTVQIQDAAGNLTTSTANVAMAIGTNPGSGTLSGTVTVDAVGGTATFSTLQIDKAGTGYTLTATSAGLTLATSGAFNITAGAPAKLSFITQPTTAVAGVAITPAVTVQVQDAAGNLTTSTASVTAAIGTNPGSGTLSGTVTVNAVSGTASFTTLSIDKIGTGYTLGATSNLLTAATSSTFDITPAAAATLVLSASGTTAAGATFSTTLTALDQFGNAATGYRGTVHFTTTDSNASVVLPADYTFVAGDNGGHLFTGVKLATAGNQTVTATDTVTGSITGTSGNIAVSAVAASNLAVSAPATATAGLAISSTVTALDPYGNTAISYTGTVHFTTTDARATVPADYLFVAGDNGVHVFTGDVTLLTAGLQTVTATDAVTGSITGTSSGTTVSAAAAEHLAVSAPGTATAGVAASVTVTAQDQFNNTATSYTGTVHFTKTDSAAGAAVPLDYTFTVGDNGVHTFTSGVTLVTAGSQTVAATDTGASSITGTSGNIIVSPATTSHLVVTAPGTALPGTPISITLTALDAFNNITTAYLGTVTFAKSDSGAGSAVPANYTFQAGDSGVHTFTGGVTFATPGPQTVTATDTLNAGVTGFASVNVGTVNPTPVQLVPTDPITGLPLPPGSSYPVSGQSGLFEVRTSITNTTPFPINGFRLSVDYSAYLAAQPSLRLYNSSSAPGAVPAFIDYPFPMAVGATVSLKLQFYTSTRKMPNPFSPTLAVTTLAASEMSNTDGSGVTPRINMRPNGTVLLEWDSIPGKWYRVKYSADLTNWYDSPVPVQAVANRTQWLDDGAPFTDASPATVPSRFYRVNEIAAPTP